jgi:hypothetical protein
MTKETQFFVVSETRKLLKTSSACPGAKEAARRFLDAVGTANEKAEATKYLQELKEDLEPIDNVLAFAKSPSAEKYFGFEGAKKFLDHVNAMKENGVKYCDCPACLIAEAILKEKDAILK